MGKLFGTLGLATLVACETAAPVRSNLDAATDATTVERAIGALIVAGVDPQDLADPAAFLAALDAPPRRLPRLERLFAEPSVFEGGDAPP